MSMIELPSRQRPLTLLAIVVFFVPTFGDLFLEKANFWCGCGR